MAQHTIELPCIADTYIDTEYPSLNYGSQSSLYVSRKAGSSSYVRHILLKFDSTSLPNHKRYILAKIKLYTTEKYVEANASSPYIYSNADKDFNENTITYEIYNNLPYNYPYYQGQTANINNLATNLYNDLYVDIKNLREPFVFGIYETIGGLHPFEAYVKFSSKETSNPPILVVIYEDVPPSKPTLNEPIGSFEINTEVIRLSWNYISSVGGTQKGFNLQWSTDQSTWTTVSETTANNYYDAPANTFSAGNVYWRVQTINEYDETSDYSDIAAFYAIGAPETPITQSVTNSAKPTITWASSGQQVYQVQVLQDETILHDSGILPGMETRSYKLPIYLANGDYTAKVRIKNEYDMFSEWGIADFTLSVVPPDKPTLSAQKTILGIELHVINNSDKALIYRDNVCIASITGDAFTDYSAAHGVEYEYFVRAVNDSEAFNDSDSVFIRPELKNNLFAPVSDLGDIIRLKYNKNTIPSKTSTLSPISAATYYSGRKHAVTEFSEHEESVMIFSFFVQDLEIIKKFKDLIKSKETVLFRDARGRKIYGTLSGWNEIDDRSGHQIGFTLTEADYDEEVIE